jgi:hypothetical protein
MTETAHSTPDNKRYNAELSLLDGLHEFHPDSFKALSPSEQETLQTYYLLGKNVPENIFQYRRELILNNPGLVMQARSAFVRLCEIAGVKDFTYE